MAVSCLVTGQVGFQRIGKEHLRIPRVSLPYREAELKRLIPTAVGVSAAQFVARETNHEPREKRGADLASETPESTPIGFLRPSAIVLDVRKIRIIYAEVAPADTGKPALDCAPGVRPACRGVRPGPSRPTAGLVADVVGNDRRTPLDRDVLHRCHKILGIVG